ncbi:MAG: hypothetical protein JW892_12425, partial [Anaerolineae bacterium]|nr:hypothetical protein [Anaerolineae bacterium]
RFIMEDPGRYLLLSLSRVRAYFEFWPTPDSTLIHNLGRTGSFGLFLPFMLYGLYLHLKPRPPVAAPQEKFPATLPATLPATSPAARLLDFILRPSSLLLLFILFYTLMHILTWAMVRYRLPVDAVLLPFAALALGALAQRFWTLINADQR